MASNGYLIGFLGLARMMESAGGLQVLGPQMESRVAQNPTDANALLDLSTLLFFTANPDMREFAFAYQQRALDLRQVYKLAPPANPAALKLLVLMAAGDMTSNTPVDCLLEGADIHVTLLYVLPGRPLPSPLPDHDVIFVAIGESSANQVLLGQLEKLPSLATKPILNAPGRISQLTRDRVSELLKSVAGTIMPATVIVERQRLLLLQREDVSLDELMDGGRFPIIARPLDSQGGKGLVKLDDRNDLKGYLADLPNAEFYISNFVDYRSPDGQFKKYRIVLVDGRPFGCHLAISSNWMIHYINADMDASASKRLEEEQFLTNFDSAFAERHRQSLSAIHDRIGLDYLAIDCAETPDGNLLVFEVDNAAIVHDLDDPAMYPYKPPAMQRIFGAFREMLVARARSSERIPSDATLDNYRRAISLNPDSYAAHYNLANALRDQGNLDDALASYRKAISLRPEFAEAYINLGLVLENRGRLKEAVDSYDKAISSDPTNAIAHNNRGNALNTLGQFEAAVASFQRAIELDERSEFKANFVRCIRNREFAHVDDGMRRLVARAISEPWAWKSELVGVGASVAKADPNISECIERALRAWPRRLGGKQFYGPSGLKTFSNDLVLRALLQNAPICDVDLERCLVVARQALLDVATGLNGDDPTGEILSFYCALAQQCFINEYVFICDDHEWSRAASLREKLMLALQSGNAVPPHWIATVAAYFPLLSIPGIEKLLHQSHPESVRILLAQQIAEPLEESRDRDAIPRLTAVESGVSSAVQQQYEENPYPRWVKLPVFDRVATIDAFLRQQFPFASFRPLGKGNDIDFLVAGCGTGGESIQVAQLFSGARILAIDLSLSSLCYAKRKTRELGLTGIEYAQADIMRLESIGRSFDVISSVGVLHHLADPTAGLHRLLSLLRPGGFMRLGLYSELARQIVVRARQFIDEHGYASTADDIRRCRQDLIDGDEQFAALTLSGDFYSTSECRDLLFHVQEHRFTIPQIKEALRAAGLDFIGFGVDPSIASAYATHFPRDKTRTDLDLWHRFETEFPDTFAGMYDFWVQKPLRS